MSRLTQYLFNNLQYKISALVLGALIWYFVQGEQILEINRKIRVKLITRDGYLVKGSALRYKDATLAGPRVLLGNFSKQVVDAYITIPADQTGILRYRVDKEYIPGWDSRIKIVIYDPYMDVEIDEKLTRAVLVQENIQGIPQEGYILEKSSVNPKKVLITGLKSQIADLKHILTNAIDVSTLNQSKSFDLGLNTQNLDSVTLSVKEVNVKLQIGEKKVNRRYGNIPIELEGQEFVTKIRPAFVAIVIQGTPGVINPIVHSDFKAFLDIRDLKAGKYQREIQVKIPKDTVLIETLPEQATIEVTNKLSRND